MYLEISNPMDYHAALYIRLSKEDESEGPSESVNNQQSLLNEFVQQHRLSVYDTYIDDGWSGTNFDRPNFQRMITDIEARKVNMVITKEDCVIIELNQKALENRDFVMWFCFFDPKTDTFYTLLAQGGGARRVERPQQHS